MVNTSVCSTGSTLALISTSSSFDRVCSQNLLIASDGMIPSSATFPQRNSGVTGSRYCRHPDALAVFYRHRTTSTTRAQAG